MGEPINHVYLEYMIQIKRRDNNGISDTFLWDIRCEIPFAFDTKYEQHEIEYGCKEDNNSLKQKIESFSAEEQIWLNSNCSSNEFGLIRQQLKMAENSRL